MNINEEILKAYFTVITEGVISLKFAKAGDLAVSVNSSFSTLSLSCQSDVDIKTNLKREFGAISDIPSLKNMVNEHFFKAIGTDNLLKMIAHTARP